MDKKASNILEGEADESSDEELSDYGGFIQNTMVVEKDSAKVAQRSSPFEAPSGGVVVTGEAPESDTDDQDMFALPREIPSLQNQHLLGDVTMKVEDETSVGREGVVWKKFQSPFHKKLWERNFSLRLGVVQGRIDQWRDMYRKLDLFIPHANKAQLHAQDALHSYCTAGETAKYLTNQVESVLYGTVLPDLNETVSLD